MDEYNCVLDDEANAILVNLQDEQGNDHAFRFDFDPRSGRYDCEELEQLEKQIGPEWLEKLEAHVRKLVDQVVMTRRRAERDDHWGL
jgi:hypothetical protein